MLFADMQPAEYATKAARAHPAARRTPSVEETWQDARRVEAGAFGGGWVNDL
jgi:hypothetical protein